MTSAYAPPTIPLTQAFRKAKHKATTSLYKPLPSHCKNKTVVPHRGIKDAREFPACPHPDEFLHCVMLGFSFNRPIKETLGVDK